MKYVFKSLKCLRLQKLQNSSLWQRLTSNHHGTKLYFYSLFLAFGLIRIAPNSKALILPYIFAA